MPALDEANAEALQAVGRELSASLGEVRGLLEAAAERIGDDQSLISVAELMHLVRGALRVVDIGGGALLAEEMEASARTLARSTDRRQVEDGLDALLRGAMQLPDYVDRVLAGGRDLAMVLMPLLNDLRAVRGASLFSEGTLFALNLSSGAQPADRGTGPGTGEPLVPTVRRLRPRFQSALLTLLRGEAGSRPVAILGAVAAEVEAAATTAPVYQLWWVVGAVLEALESGGLDDSAAIKRLLGQADRELKRLMDLDETRYAESPPVELLNNLLFYVAGSTTEGPRISAVRDSFRLRELLPSRDLVREETQSLAGPSARLMKTVAGAIKDDLARVKDALDLFVRKGGQPEELGQQVALLTKIGDTLAVLGTAGLRESVQSELSRLEAMVERRLPADREGLIGIAAALISVESGLDDALVKLVMPAVGERAGVIQDADFRQVADAVLRECGINLARIKEIVSESVTGGGDPADFEQVPGLTRGVTAGLLMLGKTRAMDVMDRIGRQVPALLGDVSDHPPPGELVDRLADAVVALEYYMDTLRAGRGDAWYMLDNAEHCLVAIEARPESSVRPLPRAEPAPAPVDEPTLVLQQVPEAMPIVDADLLEVFVEEAREELAVIAELFPRWREEAADQQALGRLRRAFHTLKGSGRMVGATALGELAWAVENLLNRYLNGTCFRSGAAMDTLQAVVDLLPAVVEGIALGRLGGVVGGPLIARLEALASGEAVAEAEAPDAPEEAEVVEEFPAIDELEIGSWDPDPTLGDIFRLEMRVHLDVAREFLRRAWIEGSRHRVTEDLYRAVHTLRGASRSAEAETFIRLAEPLHRWLHRMFDADLPMDEMALNALTDAVSAFDDLLDTSPSGVPEPVDTDALMRRLDSLAAIAERLASHLESEAENPTMTVEVPSLPWPEEPEPQPAEAPPQPLDMERILPAVEVEAAVLLEPPEVPGMEVVPPPLPVDGSMTTEVPYLPGGADAPVDYEPEIAAVFSEEATELLETADAALGALRAERGSRDRLVEMQRALHTIKGGARMAGITAMGDLSHELETLLTLVAGAVVDFDLGTQELLQASLDELNRMRDYVNAGRPVHAAVDLIARLRQLARGEPPEPTVELEALTSLPDAAPPVQVDGEATLLIQEPLTTEPLTTEPSIEEASVEPAPTAPVSLPGREVQPERSDVARVDAELLDTLLNHAGEVSIHRSRLEQQLSSIDFNLAELARVVQRLKDQLRNLEIETEAQILHRHVDTLPQRGDFDPLELDRYSTIQQYSRSLAETASDVASLQGLLGHLTRETQDLLTQQGRVVSDLQEGLMRTRMVPFNKHAQRLTRIVRQVAAEEGRRVELVIEGGSGEVDRQVLDRMLGPLEHLLRNAVVHGIEPPAARAAAGKPETGKVELLLAREGSEVVITVTDDGAGINLPAVRAKAVSLGILEEGRSITDEQARQLILEPGFSTAGRLTQAAGRGVGLDVVASEVKKLGGALFIDSRPGGGTRFVVRLPFTLAITQALVVRSGEELFALPLPAIEGVVRVPAAEVARQLAGEAAPFEYAGQSYRFQHLSAFVGNEPQPAPDREPAVPVILVRAGEHSTGIVSDELFGSREIVVKTVGPQISGIRGISGATILGDGRICIILDVGALVRSDWRLRGPLRPAAPRVDTRPLALVVDDSITVRRVTQRLLERNGLRVVTAKDGLDAMAVLQDKRPDVILLDIEMPRMDGYEVAAHVRGDPALRDIPIVMITSRVGDKHRARAIELGVSDYLGKPYQESQLLRVLEPLVGRGVEP
ncbi:MAG: Hpt domain-containing protein [Steroidobacteraceae bacterium]